MKALIITIVPDNNNTTQTALLLGLTTIINNTPAIELETIVNEFLLSSTDIAKVRVNKVE